MKLNLFLILAVMISATMTAQKTASTVFINVLIDADGKIMVEQESVSFDEVEEAVKTIIYNKPFRIDQKLVFRIYGDESLKLGVIMDVENEMSKDIEGVVTRRYLLNTQKLNPDGEDWLQKVRQLDLKAIERN